MLYAAVVFLVVFLIGNLFLASQTAALVAFIAALCVFFGLTTRGSRLE